MDANGYPRIVILDDESYIIEIITLAICQEYPQAEIVPYANGDEAWNEVLQRDPDLFILDDCHPGIRGSQIVRQLADRKAKFPMILMTGLDEPAFEKFKRRFDGLVLKLKVLRKPFKVEELYTAIKDLLEPRVEPTEEHKPTKAVNPEDQEWVTATTTVHCPNGFCARSSAAFVKCASRFKSMMLIEKDGEKVNAKSIMGLMMLAVGPGSEITIHAKGPDAKTAVAEILALISRDFDIDWRPAWLQSAPKPAPAEPAAFTFDVSANRTPRPCIMVVDEEPLWDDWLSTMFQSAYPQAEISCYRNCEEAWNELSRSGANLLFLGEGAGHQLLNWLTEKKAKFPVLLTTVCRDCDKVFEDTLAQYGHGKFLPMPFTLEDFLATVAELLQPSPVKTEEILATAAALLEARLEKAPAENESETPQVEQLQPEPTEVAPETKHRIGLSPRIIILEDERLFVELYDAIIRPAYPQAEIRSFADGYAALEYITKHEPDLFILDYAHPGMNGAEVLKRLSDSKARFPVIFAPGVENPRGYLPDGLELNLTASSKWEAIASIAETIARLCTVQPATQQAGHKPKTSPHQKTDLHCPQIADAESESELQPLSSEQPQVRSKYPRVVILDDEKFMAELISAAIKHKYPQAEIIHHTNGVEAWKDVSHRDPDLFILNESYPGIHGRRIVRPLANRKAKFPIILMTWLDEPAFEKFKRRFDGLELKLKLLRRPFELEELYMAMKELYEPCADSNTTDASNVPAGFAAPLNNEQCSRPTASPRVVILDDDDIPADFAAYLIRHEYPQAEIVRFTDGDEAWLELLQRDPDLLVLDEVHPGMFGREILQRLADRKAKLPVIFCTSGAQPTCEEITKWLGEETPEAVEAIAELKASPHGELRNSLKLLLPSHVLKVKVVLKPFKPSELVTAMNELLELSVEAIKPHPHGQLFQTGAEKSG
jgi:phosphocarrier protein HPr